MNVSGIHSGTLRMYGGFIFKQWKKQFLHLTAEGRLLLCHDALSLPHQMIQLQSNCEAIVQGKEILDLPKLPAGASRDCCFALILPQNKYLLLLAETPSDCCQWLNVLKKVKQNRIMQIRKAYCSKWLNDSKTPNLWCKTLSSHLSMCKRHQLAIALHDLVSEQIQEKDPLTPPVSDTESSSPGPTSSASPRDKGRNFPSAKTRRGRTQSVGCLRHGTSSNAQAMRAIYLLMGGAAASSAMGYLGACSSTNLEVKVDLPLNADFSGTGATGAYHFGGPALESPHFNSFDFEVADSDFDAFDCGGFTF